MHGFWSGVNGQDLPAGRLPERKRRATAGTLLVLLTLLLVTLASLKVVDRFTDGITGLARREHAVPCLLADELLYQAGDYGIVRIAICEGDGGAGLALAETGLVERGATVLAIERGDAVLASPGAEEIVRAGDYLLCYGKVARFFA